MVYLSLASLVERRHLEHQKKKRFSLNQHKTPDQEEIKARRVTNVGWRWVPNSPSQLWSFLDGLDELRLYRKFGCTAPRPRLVLEGPLDGLDVLGRADPRGDPDEALTGCLGGRLVSSAIQALAPTRVTTG